MHLVIGPIEDEYLDLGPHSPKRAAGQINYWRDHPAQEPEVVVTERVGVAVAGVEPSTTTWRRTTIGAPSERGFAEADKGTPGAGTTAGAVVAATLVVPAPMRATRSSMTASATPPTTMRALLAA
jgi:hypothetical protein